MTGVVGRIMAKSANNMGETYLLDALNRIGRNPFGYSVLYVNISKLKPKNRHPEFVKIFAKLFDSMVGNAQGSFFVMSNGDFAILGKGITSDMVEEAVFKIRQGLSSDPVLHGHDVKDFAVLYSFPADYISFCAFIEKMRDNADYLAEITVQPEVKRPIRADEIDMVTEQLDMIDIPEIIKRQSVMKLCGAGKFKVEFQEFFVAVKDLSSYLDGKLDLLASRWLFLYLTQKLDKKTMSSFFASDIKNWPNQISLNLNLSSVFSVEFVTLAKKFLRPGQKLIVEIQLMDVFNNLPVYFKVKEILKAGGHRLLIDSMSPTLLNMLNLKRLEPDMIKLFWEPLMEYDVANEGIKEIVEFLGADNVVLAKCDSDKALAWGMKYGLNTFQGPLIDRLEVACVQQQCPDAKYCSAKTCLKRRRLLWGAFRDECTQKETLEKLLEG